MPLWFRKEVSELLRKQVMQTVVHNKTGNVYLVLENLTDCTNSEGDKDMVLYMNLQGRRFVRELNEFYEKFTPVDPSDIKYVKRKGKKKG